MPGKVLSSLAEMNLLGVHCLHGDQGAGGGEGSQKPHPQSLAHVPRCGRGGALLPRKVAVSVTVSVSGPWTGRLYGLWSFALLLQTVLQAVPFV